MSTIKKCEEKIITLKSVLEKESNQLRRGRLTDLLQISKVKHDSFEDLMVLVQQIRDSQVRRDYLEEIRMIQNLAQRNLSLLASVKSGVRSARERLLDLQYANAKVGAYFENGKGVSIDNDQFLKNKWV